MTWTRAEFMRECFRGGPGLSGYAYRADTWCPDCAEAEAAALPDSAVPAGEGDPRWTDSDHVPQPVFFGDSDRACHCASCGEYLYGTDSRPTD